MKLFASAILVGALTTVAMPAFAQQVVVNGGFETNAGGQTPPWVFNGGAGAAPIAPHSGAANAIIAGSFLGSFSGGATQLPT